MVSNTELFVKDNEYIVILYDPKLKKRAVAIAPLYDRDWQNITYLEGLDFIWREGNNACDCNKRGYFKEYADLLEADNICTHNIIVDSLILPNGAVLINKGEFNGEYKDGRIIHVKGWF